MVLARGQGKGHGWGAAPWPWLRPGRQLPGRGRGTVANLCYTALCAVRPPCPFPQPAVPCRLHSIYTPPLRPSIYLHLPPPPFGNQIYMQNVIAAGEKVLAALRLELFRTLLMQRIPYFDSHTASELSNLISVELDTVRSFIFK